MYSMSLAASDLRGLVLGYLGGKWVKGLRERVENDHEIPNQFWSILIGKLSLFTN